MLMKEDLVNIKAKSRRADRKLLREGHAGVKERLQKRNSMIYCPPGAKIKIGYVVP